MSEPVRIGVLGAARIAPMALVRPARDLDGVEVTTVAARDLRRARKFADKHGIASVADSYDALIADPSVDAIYNPLPNGLHGAWTIRALEAGKHVLCEKPFTANADEAREVAAVADAHPDLVVMEAFHWRYHPLADAVLEEIAAGEIGEIRHVDAAFCAPVPPSSDIRWQLDLAGGSFMDMGCYVVSLARTFVGEEPEVVAARAKTRSADVDRYLQADLVFPGGATAKATAGMLTGRLLDAHVTITGSEGRISILNPLLPHVVGWATVRGRSGQRRLHIERRATYSFQLEAFRDAVRDGAPYPTTPEWSVANMAVIDAAYEAAGLPPRTPTPAA